MKKKRWIKVMAFILIFFLVMLVLLIVMISAQDKITADQQANACADGSTSAVAGDVSYSGDLGAIRVPWVGAATYTSKFGMRVNPGNLWKGRYMMHEGVDIGETPSPNLVVSATKGTFKRDFTDSSGANIAEVDVGGGTILQYIHLASFAPGLKPGDPVWPGEPLGQEGETGNASGPHLHFQVNINGKPTEPLTWLTQHGLHGMPAPDAVGTVLPVGPPAVTIRPANLNAPSSSHPASSSSSSPVQAVASSSSGATIATGTVELPATSAPGVEYTTNPPASIPADILADYQKSAKDYGIPWQLLAGIGMAETGHGRIKAVSSAGAQGPMQFMPGTWASEGKDGNGDGIKDILNPADAIEGAANKLVLDGAHDGPAGIRRAILAYNHSIEYLNSVVSYIKFYAGGKATISGVSGGTDVAAAVTCDVVSSTDQSLGTTGASSAYEQAAVAAAQSQLGIPYVWAGGDQNGPTLGGYDCSGLSMYVVAQATKKATGHELVMPHQTDEQYHDTDLGTVATYSGTGTPSYATMRPGDVIIFNLISGEDRHAWNHAGIYIGGGKMIHAPHPGGHVEVVNVPDAGPGAWVALRPKTIYTGGNSSASSSTPGVTSSTAAKAAS